MSCTYNLNSRLMSNLKSEVSIEAIKTLQSRVRSNWVNSVEMIYQFAKQYTKECLEQKIVSFGMKVTSKANAFTCAAKLAVAEEVSEGKWVANDAQVSRYSKACIHLNDKNVPVDGVVQYLNGKSINSILVTNKKGGLTKEELNQRHFEGLFVIEQNFKKIFAEDKIINVKDLDTKPGVNLMVVVTDEAGNVTSMAVATGNPKYEEIAKEIVRSKAPKEGDTTNEDVVAAAIEERDAA